MEKGLIIIPYANKMAYQGGVNLKNTDVDKSVDVYLKNCCVACISAKTNSGESADVALVTNIDVPDPYKDMLTSNGIKIIVAEFNDFDFGGNYLWGLAFYKLCALKAALRVTDYKYYAYMDSDVFVQSDFRNIWKECDERILMYDICHGLQVEHYRHFLSEIRAFNDKISGGGITA